MPSSRATGLNRSVAVPTMAALWAMVAVAVPVAAALASRLMAIDLAYQVRAGGVMLDTHRLLDVDTFTFTVVGRPWLNQQWGSEVLLALIHRAGGWFAMGLARGALIGLIVFLIYRACRAAGARSRTAALLTLASWLIGIEILPALRPQQFGFVLFAATLWVVTTRREAPGRLWLVPLFMIPWVNLHGSFPLAFMLLGLAWLEDRTTASARAHRLLAVAGLSLLATFLNPFGPRVWGYVVQLSTDSTVLQHIGEWGPPSVRTPTGLLFFVSLFAVGLLVARSDRPIGWMPLLTLGLFGGLALLAIRGVVWWAMVAPVVVAGLLGDAQDEPDPARPALHLGVAASLIGLVLVAMFSQRGTDPATGGPAVLTYAPQNLVTAAEASAPAGTRAFVSQFYASWSEFSAPGFPVAVDPRIEIFPEPVWDDYFRISDGEEGWSGILDRWKVGVLVLQPDQASGLLEVIDDHPEWRRVMAAADGSVYVRASVAPG
jgi:hypothetical protein